MKQYMLLKVLLSVSIVTESVVAPIVVSNANQIHAADKQDGISNLTQKIKVFYIYLLPIVILLVK